MKVYFGLVDYETDGNVFEFDGMEYDFVLEVNEEGIVIKDTCGRSVPLSFNSALDLMNALSVVPLKALATAENLNFNLSTCV